MLFIQVGEGMRDERKVEKAISNVIEVSPTFPLYRCGALAIPYLSVGSISVPVDFNNQEKGTE